MCRMYLENAERTERASGAREGGAAVAFRLDVRLLQLVVRRPDPLGDRPQRVHVEAAQCGDVAADDLLQLLAWYAAARRPLQGPRLGYRDSGVTLLAAPQAADRAGHC